LVLSLTTSAASRRSFAFSTILMAEFMKLRTKITPAANYIKVAEAISQR
jgi:hypothetical protein